MTPRCRPPGKDGDLAAARGDVFDDSGAYLCREHSRDVIVGAEGEIAARVAVVVGDLFANPVRRGQRPLQAVQVDLDLR